jgi:hypothetical protein
VAVTEAFRAEVPEQHLPDAVVINLQPLSLTAGVGAEKALGRQLPDLAPAGRPQARQLEGKVPADRSPRYRDQLEDRPRGRPQRFETCIHDVGDPGCGRDRGTSERGTLSGQPCELAGEER